jgi:HEPN domain-containing protein
MNGTVREWIEKAEGDFDIALLAMHAPGRPHYDAVCFHAQQSIEKLMKGLLVRQQTRPPLTHNLSQLADLIAPLYPAAIFLVKELRFLTRVGAGFRYPGESADKDDAAAAIAICTRLREALLKLITEGNASGP